MEIPILSPLWGHEHLDLNTFLDKIRLAGYNGVDTWLPDSLGDRKLLYEYLQKYKMLIVAHQHSASGSTFKKFRSSFLRNLYACAESGPILINSHTGRDYFTPSSNIALIETALEFTAKTGILVTHETHRGRFAYSPQVAADYFAMNKDFCITADLSHWVCVTESMLENFKTIVDQALTRSRHIHARIGFEQGPQITDPRDPVWKYALDTFLLWWDKIISINVAAGRKILPVTTEFGPAPYMVKLPFSNALIADQFEINCFMKDLLAERYASYRQCYHNN